MRILILVAALLLPLLMACGSDSGPSVVVVPTATLAVPTPVARPVQLFVPFIYGGTDYHRGFYQENWWNGVSWYQSFAHPLVVHHFVWAEEDRIFMLEPFPNLEVQWLGGWVSCASVKVPDWLAEQNAKIPPWIEPIEYRYLYSDCVREEQIDPFIGPPRWGSPPSAGPPRP